MADGNNDFLVAGSLRGDRYARLVATVLFDPRYDVHAFRVYFD